MVVGRFVIVVMLVATSALAVVELPTTDVPMVIILKNDSWHEIRKLEITGPQVVYTEIGGTLRSAPAQIVDLDATHAVNAAMRVLDRECREGYKGQENPEGLSTRALKVYRAFSKRHYYNCISCLACPVKDPPEPEEFLENDGMSRIAGGRIRREHEAAKDVDGKERYFKELAIAKLIIENDCNSRWGDEVSERDACVAAETEAADHLRKGPPKGVDEDRYFKIDADCRREWPNSFAARRECIETALGVKPKS